MSDFFWIVAHHSFLLNNVKEIIMKHLKDKKLWIGAAVVVIIFAWMLWSGQPAPEVQG